MYRFFTSKPLWIALLVLAALAVVWRLVARRLRVKKGEELYRPYKKLLREAFRNDRESRNRVLEAIYYLRNGKPDKAEPRSVLRLLYVLVSSELQPAKKKTILTKDFDVPMTTKLNEEINEMCNLAEGIREKAEKRGEKRG